MKLRSVRIVNFRSIRDQTFNVEAVDGSYTFALIGANETGKSSFLEAIELVGKLDAELSQKDYKDIYQEVRITLGFELGKDDSEELKKVVASVYGGLEDYLDTTQIHFVNAIFDPIKKGISSPKRITVDTSFEDTPEDVVVDEGVRNGTR